MIAAQNVSPIGMSAESQGVIIVPLDGIGHLNPGKTEHVPKQCCEALGHGTFHFPHLLLPAGTPFRHRLRAHAGCVDEDLQRVPGIGGGRDKGADSTERVVDVPRPTAGKEMIPIIQHVDVQQHETKRTSERSDEIA